MLLVLTVLVTAPTSVSCARDLTRQPFGPASIWNLPIGRDAKYVKAKLSAEHFSADPDVIVLTPTAPMRDVHYNPDGWNGGNQQLNFSVILFLVSLFLLFILNLHNVTLLGSRCNPEAQILFSGPIPQDFVTGPSTKTSTPNWSGAVLSSDSITLKQGQPLTICTAGATPTSIVYISPDLRLDDPIGALGAHGGSGLSSIGGTLRVGELLPNSGHVTHALKINVYASTALYRRKKMFRWPAIHNDDYASEPVSKV